jgi:hypothetical protein
MFGLLAAVADWTLTIAARSASKTMRRRTVMPPGC